MEIGNLYQLVLMLVLVGMILGVGILTLDKFAATSGITAASAAVLGNTTAALSPIASSWLPLIVTVAVLAIILTLVLRSFAFSGTGGR
jgi:hypothetical protein